MTVCVVTTSLGSQWFYPVLDPYRTAGPGPYHYAYSFAFDLVEITVTRNTLSRCKMRIELGTSLSEPKEIQAFNFFNDTWDDQIDSVAPPLMTSMVIDKRGPGQGCGAGTDTVVLARHFAWPRLWTAMYTFPSDDFWDFWGGCTVTFDWISDTQGSGVSGAQTPVPTYPKVRFPDGTVMTDAAGTGFLVVFGGTAFAADAAYLTAMGLSTSAAIPFALLPAFPADFTLVREWNSSDAYIVFGGAKFRIPSRLASLIPGFPSASSIAMSRHPTRMPIDWDGAPRIIPPGGTANLGDIPMDGTLIKEQHDPKVFLVESGQLRWVISPAVMDARCLPWRHVRTVPDNGLAALPHGPNLV